MMLKNIHTFWKENNEVIGNALSVIVAGIVMSGALCFSYFANRGF